MYTNELPYFAESVSDLFHMIKEDPVPKLPYEKREDGQLFLERILQKDPKQRISLSQIIFEDRWLSSEPIWRTASSKNPKGLNSKKTRKARPRGTAARASRMNSLFKRMTGQSPRKSNGKKRSTTKQVKKGKAPEKSKLETANSHSIDSDVSINSGDQVSSLHLESRASSHGDLKKALEYEMHMTEVQKEVKNRLTKLKSFRLEKKADGVGNRSMSAESGREIGVSETKSGGAAEWEVDEGVDQFNVTIKTKIHSIPNNMDVTSAIKEGPIKLLPLPSSEVLSDGLQEESRPGAAVRWDVLRQSVFKKAETAGEGKGDSWLKVISALQLKKRNQIGEDHNGEKKTGGGESSKDTDTLSVPSTSIFTNISDIEVNFADESKSMEKEAQRMLNLKKFHEACSDGDLDTVRELMQSTRLDSHFLMEGLHVDDPLCRTALHFAAASDSEDMLRLLIGAGADVHAVDVNENTRCTWLHKKAIGRYA